MPIYSFSCETCGREFDEVRRLSECGQSAKCACGGSAKQVIAPAGLPPWQPFESQIIGGSFPTRESFNAHCKKHGLTRISSYEIKLERERASYEKAKLAERRRKEQSQAAR